MTAQVIDLFSRRVPDRLALVSDPGVSRQCSEDELVRRFLALKSGTTVDDYRRDIAYFRKWLRDESGHGLDLYEAEEWHVGDWKTYMLEIKDWEHSTVRRRMSAVGSMYEWALRSKLHDRNPEYAVDRPSVGDNVQYTGLVVEDLKRLAAHVQGQDILTRVVFALLMTTGMRVSELCKAHVAGLVPDGTKVRLQIVRKGGKRDTVEIPSRALGTLLTYLDGRSAGPLVLGERGAAISRHVVWRMVRRCGDAALPHLAGRLHPHDLRHSFISAVLILTGSVREAKTRGGHTDINHTMRYVHALQIAESTTAADLEDLLGICL
ncbi:tyrosine-type recombinase/integrase [Streptomyces sp. NPDC088252]|uniref:tyrosine-type recombinase/integrase n=1 Tax=Streptomyces sp. NPDC088252 TaxID=3365845 RepID=UPI0038000B83